MQYLNNFKDKEFAKLIDEKIENFNECLKFKFEEIDKNNIIQRNKFDENYKKYFERVMKVAEGKLNNINEMVLNKIEKINKNVENK